MGDTGSHFLGVVLAAITIVGIAKVSVGLSILVPLIALALPISDTAGRSCVAVAPESARPRPTRATSTTGCRPAHDPDGDRPDLLLRDRGARLRGARDLCHRKIWTSALSSAFWGGRDLLAQPPPPPAAAREAPAPDGAPDVGVEVADHQEAVFDSLRHRGDLD